MTFLSCINLETHIPHPSVPGFENYFGAGHVVERAFSGQDLNLSKVVRCLHSANGPKFYCWVSSFGIKSKDQILGNGQAGHPNLSCFPVFRATLPVNAY